MRAVLPSVSSAKAAPCVLWLLLSAVSTASALGAGDEAPSIDLPDQHGKQVDLRALAGEVVLVDFWASWCGPCKQEMPVLEALHQRYAKEGLVVIGVNIDHNPKRMRQFLKRSPATFRIVHDRKLTVASRYEPATIPSSYFIARDGTIRYVHEGFRKKDAIGIEARIKQLLAETVGAERAP